MDIFLIAFLVFAVAVGAMAIGAILGGRRIKGSCGGLAAWKDPDGNSICEACADCPEKKKECELENREMASTPAGGLSARKERAGR